MKRTAHRRNWKRYTLAALLGLVLWSYNHLSYADIRSRIVLISGNGVACTGEQIRAPSGEDYILSAAHCIRTITEGRVGVTTEDGKTLSRGFIAEDPTSDLMLIEGLPNVRGLDIAGHLSRSDQVSAFTRGGMKPTYQSTGVVVGLDTVITPVELDLDHCTASKYTQYPSGAADATCLLSVEETVSTTPIIPGSSGGPLLNSSGEVVGVASMLGEGFSYWVKLSDIRAFLAGY